MPESTQSENYGFKGQSPCLFYFSSQSKGMHPALWQFGTHRADLVVEHKGMQGETA